MVKFDPKVHHRRSIRLQGYDYSQAGAYFVTIVTWQRQFLFGEIVNNEMELSSYGEIVQKWWGEIPIHFPNVETGAFVIMPNHVHGIIFILERRGTVSVPEDNDAKEIFQDNKTSPNLQGGETPPLHVIRVPTLGQVVAYFKYQSTKEINTVESAGTITKFWQRNYASRALCGVTNTLSATRMICKTKQITSKPIRCYGMRMMRIQSI